MVLPVGGKDGKANSPQHPFYVLMVGGNGETGEDPAAEIMEMLRSNSVRTSDLPLRIVTQTPDGHPGYDYVDMQAGVEGFIAVNGGMISIRNMSMDETVYYAPESGKEDRGIPLLPRNASRIMVFDENVYIYAKADTRVHYTFLEVV
ncbi:hypothetical protein [Paenibacillus xylanexedens]|uniref:hypothetical protein n=1 Tax=Paenibacillus xylanexedens TaxID=528191 RepID=UPI0011AB0838|nr:hypothetical protein [Paenibacillus xylanexedens]